jgi:hypothetical protein
VWALLSAITIGTWLLGHVSTSPGMTGGAVVTVAALIIAAVKVQLIIWNFMEVRDAPIWLRSSTTIWLVVLIALIVSIYLW